MTHHVNVSRFSHVRLVFTDDGQTIVFQKFRNSSFRFGDIIALNCKCGVYAIFVWLSVCLSVFLSFCLSLKGHVT